MCVCVCVHIYTHAPTYTHARSHSSTYLLMHNCLYDMTTFYLHNFLQFQLFGSGHEGGNWHWANFKRLGLGFVCLLVCSAVHGYRQATVRMCDDGGQGRLIKEMTNWKKRGGGGGEEEGKE